MLINRVLALALAVQDLRALQAPGDVNGAPLPGGTASWTLTRALIRRASVDAQDARCSARFSVVDPNKILSMEQTIAPGAHRPARYSIVDANKSLSLRSGAATMC